ncbi:bifunctional 5,10-methylenetetrahydrofolate dehydrogenase/5,10-methenyltetrahydrofolate cyclohydrolase [Candidatus Kaiserbacteria bacterium]|nr:bifunctional 5,10-methylenetetrahydrofolate dehydrogenase/5,10-methenyltetrahydrofolate cyclohydrolase [Candidatus Kaiserbacteria bacterium]
MIIDGRAIAKEILDELAGKVAGATRPPRLTIITCAPNFETQKYLTLKQRKASEVGIETNVIELATSSTTSEVTQAITTAAGESDGVVVQLPLPAQIDTDAVLAAIPFSHDVDAIHYDGSGEVLPPVVGAIAEIANRCGVSFNEKRVTIVGAGRLVGAPAALWAVDKGAYITIVTKETDETDVAAAIATADIIISGAGAPHLLTPKNIKTGVALFDAGTSEDDGNLVGDADPACADKASIFTPVPGGIGPITIAVLFKNLLILQRQ